MLVTGTNMEGGEDGKGKVREGETKVR